MQHFVPASRIWGNCALNTFLIVRGNDSNSSIDKKKSKWKYYYIQVQI